MKKLVMILLGAALCLQLTGCSAPTGGAATKAPNQDESLEAFNATMEASFYGNVDAYNEFINSSSGQSLYESEVESYAYGLMYWAQVEEEYMDDATYEGFLEVAQTVLSKVDWEVKNFYAVNSDNGCDGIMEVYLYPTDMMDLMYDDVQDAMLAYNELYEDYDIAELEAYYAEMILQIAQAYAGQAKPVSTPDKKLYWYDLDGASFSYDGAIISNTDWSEVDMLVMDFDRL